MLEDTKSIGGSSRRNSFVSDTDRTTSRRGSRRLSIDDPLLQPSRRGSVANRGLSLDDPSLKVPKVDGTVRRKTIDDPTRKAPDGTTPVAGITDDFAPYLSQKMSERAATMLSIEETEEYDSPLNSPEGKNPVLPSIVGVDYMSEFLKMKLNNYAAAKTTVLPPTPVLSSAPVPPKTPVPPSTIEVDYMGEFLKMKLEKSAEGNKTVPC